MRRTPWPLLIIAAPAAVAIWSGWVALGQLAGFGMVQPLPGILPWHLDTAITLPIGIEAYGAYALGVWLSGVPVPSGARRFARWSAIGALGLGMTGQVASHLLMAAHVASAPWPVTVLVSCVPVVTLGFAAALTHLLRAGSPGPAAVPVVAGPVKPETVPAVMTPRETPRKRRGSTLTVRQQAALLDKSPRQVMRYRKDGVIDDMLARLAKGDMVTANGNGGAH